MAEVLLRRRAVEAITGLSRSGIYRGMAEGRFPLPVTIENRTVALVESEVSAWTAARIADHPHPCGFGELIGAIGRVVRSDHELDLPGWIVESA